MQIAYRRIERNFFVILLISLCQVTVIIVSLQASQFAALKARVDELEGQRVILADSVATLEVGCHLL